jgi:sulfur-carrier protein adenylyltransferase/sulfurtransferase
VAVVVVETRLDLLRVGIRVSGIPAAKLQRAKYLRMVSDATREPGAAALTIGEMDRYARHLTLPGIGIAGQQRLKAASVLIVGAGGLGSPAALYLAAAGVGRIGLVDADRVELSNLQRQILHTTGRVGALKVDSAKETLRELNPLVRVETHAVRLNSANVAQLIAGYDLVIDGTDNFATRYATSDACVVNGTPYLYASVQRFDGQLSFFGADNGPCYRCLFPVAPAPGSVPSCAEAGVFGVMPGLMGILQATEAIKWITGTGTLLVGRLLMVNALQMQFREIAFERDPACPSCGDGARTAARGPVAESASPQHTAMLSNLTPIEIRDALATRSDVMLVDVREPGEHAIAHIDGATLIPLRNLPQQLESLPRDREILLHCHHGMRSEMAGNFLLSQGFLRVSHMVGGIDRWSDDVDPAVQKY